MRQICTHVGRRRAISLFWTLIPLLIFFAIYEKWSSVTDFTVVMILATTFVLFLVLSVYILKSKHKFVSGNLIFTFSKEHGGVVEMHLKRTCCRKTSALRTSIIAALYSMRKYAEKVGASKLKIESPLLDAKTVSILAGHAARRLGVSYYLHKPRDLNRVVSILAHRAIHKCDNQRPKLRESYSAKLVAHGFTLELPT